MTRYLTSFDANAMDHIPDEDMPAVAKAAHEVLQEAMDAGTWVFGGGLEHQKASIVRTDASSSTIRMRPWVGIGGKRRANGRREV